MANEEIRTILAPLTTGHVLLPNTAVAELLNFTIPEPLRKAPAWILGELAWHGWQVPVISYEFLINGSNNNTVTSKARILVIKTLGESTQLNYIGLIIQGLPKLKKVSADTLIEKPADELPDAVFSKITIDNLDAVIPELGGLTRIVEEAAYIN
jgi:chemosensory pili system protein ChpC